MKYIFLVFMFILILSSVSANCTKNQIDINSASLKKLDDIIWVGQATAQKIVNARPYKTIDELKKVKGIGDKKLQAIKKQNIACVGGSIKQISTKSKVVDKISGRVIKKNRITHNETQTKEIHNTAIQLKKPQTTISLNKIKKDPQQIYISKNAKIINHLAYYFSIFLIFIIIILIWERF